MRPFVYRPSGYTKGIMEAQAEILRTQLRANDGDLYLCHLFTPPDQRARMLALYAAYSEIARIPGEVSAPMVGAIRLQWWRDALASAAAGSAASPFVAALASVGFRADDIACLIDGRTLALERAQSPTLDVLETEAAIVGPAFMRLSLEALGLGETPCPDWARDAGIGFELVRLAHNGPSEAVMTRATTWLQTARSGFNALPRRDRAKLLPAFLIIGLTARFARRWPAQDLLLRHQMRLLVSAFRGKI